MTDNALRKTSLIPMPAPPEKPASSEQITVDSLTTVQEQLDAITKELFQAQSGLNSVVLSVAKRIAKKDPNDSRNYTRFFQLVGSLRDRIASARSEAREVVEQLSLEVLPMAQELADVQ